MLNLLPHVIKHVNYILVKRDLGGSGQFSREVKKLCSRAAGCWDKCGAVNNKNNVLPWQNIPIFE